MDKKSSYQPKVSIICSWFNRANFLAGTLDSLLSLDYDNFEVLVINDGSTDPNVERILGSYSDPRLRYETQDNTGFTVAIQRAANSVNGEYICVMGAGDRVAPNKLRMQVEFMERYPDTAALGTGHILVSADTGRVIGYEEPMVEATTNSLRSKVPFTHGTVMYRSSVLRHVHGYNPFFKYCQDWDLYHRIARVSKIRAINEPLYEKYLFNDGASFSPSHNLSQSFYRRLARTQNLELIKYYEDHPQKMRPYLDSHYARHLPRSARMMLALARRGEMPLARAWLRLVLMQIGSLWTGRW